MCFQCQEEFLGKRVCQLRTHCFTQHLLQLQCTPVLERMIDHLPGVGLLVGQLLVRMHCIDVKKMESLRSVLLFFTLEWLLVEAKGSKNFRSFYAYGM